MMRYSYYPGCSMSATGIEYGKSLRFVNERIGMQFVEIPDWNCCGATAGHMISRELGAALPARNIALCEAQDLGLPIAVPCASCYSRMQHATHELREGEAQRAKLARLIEMPVRGDLDILTLMEVYAEPEAKAAIEDAVVRPLEGLKVACYYGCLYSRPPKITGNGDPENPMMIEEVVELTGAQTVDWSFKTECCGSSRHVDLPGECRPLVYRILKNARASGAQALVTACPMCMMNLDMRQGAVNKAFHENFDLPVYFITELLAMAMGATAKQCGVSTHFHPAKALMERVTSGKGVG